MYWDLSLYWIIDYWNSFLIYPQHRCTCTLVISIYYISRVISNFTDVLLANQSFLSNLIIVLASRCSANEILILLGVFIKSIRKCSNTFINLYKSEESSRVKILGITHVPTKPKENLEKRRKNSFNSIFIHVGTRSAPSILHPSKDWTRQRPRRRPLTHIPNQPQKHQHSSPFASLSSNPFGDSRDCNLTKIHICPSPPPHRIHVVPPFESIATRIPERSSLQSVEPHAPNPVRACVSRLAGGSSCSWCICSVSHLGDDPLSPFGALSITRSTHENPCKRRGERRRAAYSLQVSAPLLAIGRGLGRHVTHRVHRLTRFLSQCPRRRYRSQPAVSTEDSWVQCYRTIVAPGELLKDRDRQTDREQKEKPKYTNDTRLARDRGKVWRGLARCARKACIGRKGGRTQAQPTVVLTSTR